MSRDPESDLENFTSLQQGDPEGLNRIIARWQRPLHSFAYRYCQNEADAEDLVAQTFVRLYHKRMQLRRDTKLSAWLFTTLTNLCHNHHRWRRRHPTAPLGFGGISHSGMNRHGTEHEEPVVDQPAPDEELAHGEELAAMRAAVEKLPHEMKTALLLHHYDRLSYREIAEITHCSERGVETRLYRARQQLRNSLGLEANFHGQ